MSETDNKCDFFSVFFKQISTRQRNMLKYLSLFCIYYAIHISFV